MNRNYIILTLIMLILAIGTIFISQRQFTKQVPPEELLWDVLQPTRFVSTDLVAKRIIEKDPSQLLIDVRSASQFESFSLPGAINVPFDSLKTSAAMAYFGNPGTKVVLFSNDGILADEAWILLRRLAYKNNYVMKGGLNGWIQTIIRPLAPAETSSEKVIEQYNFRRAASMYFIGSKTDVNKSQKAKITFVKRKKSVVAAGGC
ncbi:MAG: rhodanese-like domain-containing protein [Bacteroidales bacterium]|nr:rhodanese-like domain-containing protein [Bacteroidales bacterium]